MTTIEYTKKPLPSVEDRKQKIISLLKQNSCKTVYISRTRGELVALIPSSRSDILNRTWVWLSTQKGLGYFDGQSPRSLDSIATTIITGEWDIQPNVVIYLEDFDRS